MFKKTDNINIL